MAGEVLRRNIFAIFEVRASYEHLCFKSATTPSRKTLAVICKMKKTIQTIIIFFFFISCKKEEIVTSSTNGNEFFVSAVDISSYPEISLSNPTFYDLEQDRKDFFLILKENGINTIRLKLWVNPTSVHSGFNEVEV